MRLSGRAHFAFQGEPFVALVEARDGQTLSLRNLHPEGRRTALLSIGAPTTRAEDTAALSAEFDYLSVGDMVRLNPRSGEVRTLYRRESRHNFLFFTDRCNSRCLMCSQPPRDIDDSYLVDDILRMIPWMAKDTGELGITGGEPTLLHDRLIAVIESAKANLPTTSLHMLSNGRLLSYVRYARR